MFPCLIIILQNEFFFQRNHSAAYTEYPLLKSPDDKPALVFNKTILKALPLKRFLLEDQ